MPELTKEETGLSPDWGGWKPEKEKPKDSDDVKLIADYVMQGGTIQSLSEKTKVPAKYWVTALETAIQSERTANTAAPNQKPSDPWCNGYVKRR